MSHLTRRQFAKLGLAAIPSLGALSAMSLVRAASSSPGSSTKVDSRVNGVLIGLNVPYSFGNQVRTGDEILAACVELGVSGLELRTQPVELFLGAPANLLARGRGAAATANAEALRTWRAGANLSRVGEFRKKYEDAGMVIEIVKVDNIFRLGDAELDYVFRLGKALGARSLSAEISESEEEHARVGKFADKHQLLVGLHGHATTSPDHWEKAIAHSKYLGVNLDIGHFVAGNNYSPIDYIKKRHDRITHIHVKDRKMQEGPNTPFGEGDTPIAETLRLIRDNKWPIQATIEFEYAVPEGSTRMAEIAKCVKFCREVLAS